MVLQIIVLFITLTIILSTYYYTRDYNVTHIPFKESMDLINLPVVTFMNNNNKLHFLLDTGSDDSFITSSVINLLNIKSSSNRVSNIQTGNGTISGMGMVTLDISYLDSSYENTFIVSDLDASFKSITDTRGIQIHGIIGSLFFRRYGYKLDFKKLAAYK